MGGFTDKFEPSTKLQTVCGSLFEPTHRERRQVGQFLCACLFDGKRWVTELEKVLSLLIQSSRRFQSMVHLECLESGSGLIPADSIDGADGNPIARQGDLGEKDIGHGRNIRKPTQRYLGNI
jgi:hypothetical protein